MRDVDWNKVKKEYIQGGISIRKLSEKYGVPYKRIADRSRKEGWVDLRNQSDIKTESKIIDAVSSRRAALGVAIYDAADQILENIVGMIGDKLSPKDIRALTAALKDLKDIKDVRSDADIREQEARIEKLRKEASKEEATDNTIEVVFTGANVEEWSG